MEKKIKEAFNYEIKTTSADILMKLEKPKKIYFSKPFILGYVTIFLIVIVLSIFIFNTKDKSNIMIDDNVLSKMSLQLFYGGELSGETKQLLSNSNDEFERAKEQYNKVHNIVNDMFNSNGIINYDYDSCNFVYDNTAYNYVFSVDDYSIYLIDELKNDCDVKALFYFNNNYYSGMLEFEVEDDETEIEMSYYDGDYLISIQRDYESDEYEVEYCISLKDEEIELYEFKIELEDTLICEIEHKTATMNSSFDIYMRDGYYEIEYVEKSNIFDFNIKMKLELADNIKKFEILQ